MTKLRRSIVAPIAAAALLSTVAACGSDSSTDTSSSSTAGSSGPPSGFPGGGPGNGAPGGGLQTFTAVDLDTDGENGSDANTTDVVTAAKTFLATLDADTAAKVSYDFTDNESRQTWSNFPAQQVPRKGVALSDLDTNAKAAAMALVKTMLSAEGYAQVQAIQEADDWLRENSASGTDSFGSDTDYYIAIYGTPSASDSFMVQFGGHHLARNYTYKGTTASITPDFTGTEPKSFTIGSTDVEPMKEKAGTLFDVFDSLSEEQESQAELSDTIDDILMGPGVDSGEFPETQGVAVSDLSTDQQQLVLDAIGAWVDDAAPGVAASLMETYKSQLDQTYVAFANSDTIDGESTYLRIDGPRVWIELVNTRSQSTPNVHYHGVYRDKNDDYGSTNPSA
ncbi:DUF3500 domain-containing protein [Parafrankia sp. BMG5.11]|uniref:DUF3500 domain-containing protein n=1 Tax=Parafrankia sp. BMG5.11 TaxID=222540 RepID=UPI001FB1E665|nr:DUF3500 domain-containing protein [Parafrankia sp. BMG5.11]